MSEFQTPGRWRSRNRSWRKKTASAFTRAGGQDGFTCKHCRVIVPSTPLVSGVQNRNHCPYCLWSRHLDLRRAGDRLSACKDLMKPLGLTFKTANKKYNPLAGELMLVHRCEACGKVSLNRIAADDDSDRLLRAYEDSLILDGRTVARLEEIGIFLLRRAHTDLVLQRLFGCSVDPTGHPRWTAGLQPT